MAVSGRAAAMPVFEHTNSSLPDNSDSNTNTWESFSLARNICVGTIISIIILITIIGNLMVMIAFYRDRRIHSKVANWYIVNLSVADFAVGSFSLPLSLIYLLTRWWKLGETLCKIYLLVDYVVVTIGVYTITCISLDRFWLLTKKLDYPTYSTKTKAKLFMVSMWTFSIIFYGILAYAWIPITGFEEKIDYSYSCELEATYNFEFQLFMIAFFFALPLAIIVYLNFIIYLNIYQRSKGFVQSRAVVPETKAQTASTSTTTPARRNPERISSHLETLNPGLNSEKSDNMMLSSFVQSKDKEKADPEKSDKRHVGKTRKEFNRHRKAAITLAVLVGVFIVCWVPFYVTAILGAFCSGCVPHDIWAAANFLLWSNSMINPFLYAAMNVHFRENFAKVMHIHIKRSKRPTTFGNS